eukprot:ctg_536.g273
MSSVGARSGGEARHSVEVLRAERAQLHLLVRELRAAVQSGGKGALPSFTRDQLDALLFGSAQQRGVALKQSAVRASATNGDLVLECSAADVGYQVILACTFIVSVGRTAATPLPYTQAYRAARGTRGQSGWRCSPTGARRGRGGAAIVSAGAAARRRIHTVIAVAAPPASRAAGATVDPPNRSCPRRTRRSESVAVAATATALPGHRDDRRSMPCRASADGDGRGAIATLGHTPGRSAKRRYGRSRLAEILAADAPPTRPAGRRGTPPAPAAPAIVHAPQHTARNLRPSHRSRLNGGENGSGIAFRIKGHLAYADRRRTVCTQSCTHCTRRIRPAVDARPAAAAPSTAIAAARTACALPLPHQSHCTGRAAWQYRCRIVDAAASRVRYAGDGARSVQRTAPSIVLRVPAVWQRPPVKNERGHGRVGSGCSTGAQRKRKRRALLRRRLPSTEPLSPLLSEPPSSTAMSSPEGRSSGGTALSASLWEDLGVEWRRAAVHHDELFRGSKEWCAQLLRELDQLAGQLNSAAAAAPEDAPPKPRALPAVQALRQAHQVCRQAFRIRPKAGLPRPAARPSSAGARHCGALVSRGRVRAGRATGARGAARNGRIPHRAVRGDAPGAQGARRRPARTGHRLGATTPPTAVVRAAVAADTSRSVAGRCRGRAEPERRRHRTGVQVASAAVCEPAATGQSGRSAPSDSAPDGMLPIRLAHSAFAAVAPALCTAVHSGAETGRRSELQSELLARVGPGAREPVAQRGFVRCSGVAAAHQGGQATAQQGRLGRTRRAAGGGRSRPPLPIPLHFCVPGIARPEHRTEPTDAATLRPCALQGDRRAAAPWRHPLQVPVLPERAAGGGVPSGALLSFHQRTVSSMMRRRCHGRVLSTTQTTSAA